jgi:hypothetical protein
MHTTHFVPLATLFKYPSRHNTKTASLKTLKTNFWCRPQEFALERTLDKMQAEWAGVALGAAPWRATGTSVLRGTDDIQQLLDDQVGPGAALGQTVGQTFAALGQLAIKHGCSTIPST